jgi:hypothetical protein
VGWNTTQLKGKIAAGNPVIVLVHYGDIPRWNDSFTGGHFMVVKGFTADENVIVHDPDYWGEANNTTCYRCQGANRVLPIWVFETAWNYYNGQVVVVTCCPGDASGDRVVNALDASIWVNEWGRDCKQQLCRADFNSDGTVNNLDYDILKANYGKRCPPKPCQ